MRGARPYPRCRSSWLGRNVPDVSTRFRGRGRTHLTGSREIYTPDPAAPDTDGFVMPHTSGRSGTWAGSPMWIRVVGPRRALLGGRRGRVPPPVTPTAYGQDRDLAERTTCCATLPSSARATAPRACVPITIMSAPISSARRQTLRRGRRRAARPRSRRRAWRAGARAPDRGPAAPHRRCARRPRPRGSGTSLPGSCRRARCTRVPRRSSRTACGRARSPCRGRSRGRVEVMGQEEGLHLAPRCWRAQAARRRPFGPAFVAPGTGLR